LGADGHLVLEAGEDLFALLTLIRSHPMSMPVGIYQRFYFHAKRYLQKLAVLDIGERPKDHMLIELASRIPMFGSPKLYGCWEDESLNRLLRDVAGNAHSMVHERRVLVEFKLAYSNVRDGRTITKRRRVSE